MLFNKIRLLNVLAILLLVFGNIYIAFLLGIIPFNGFPTLGINYAVMGAGNYLANNGIFHTTLKQFGYPYGSPSDEMFFPYIVISLTKLFTNNIIFSTVFTYLIFYVCSVFCLIYFFYKITKNLYVSWFFSILFYIDPLIVSQVGIPAVFFGIMLIPISLCLDYYLSRIKSNQFVFLSWKNAAIFALCYLVRLLYPSTSWYIAVILAAASCLYFLLSLCFRKEFSIRAWGFYLLFIIVPWLLAAVSIKILLPSDITSFSSPLDFFRGTSPDVLSLLLPTDSQYISKIFSINTYLSNKSLSFPGDSTMWFNYLGIVLIAVSLFFTLKNRHKPNVKAFSLIFFVFLILALGPALKFNNTIVKTGSITYESYLLSSKQTLLEFPWDFIYKIFPFNMMRANYRWLIVPKILLLIGSCYGLALLKEKKKNVLYYSLIILLLIDFLPKTFAPTQAQETLSEIHQFNKDVIAPMKKYNFSLNDRVVFIPSENDYLAPYISSEVGFTTYNSAGDKSLAISAQYFPDSIRNLLADSDIAKLNQDILEVKEKGLAEYVIMPYFSLRWESYYWPVSKSTLENYKSKADQIAMELAKDGIQVYNEKYFTIIKLSDK
ncbi:hypothetical protein [Paenibacillus pinistramenti]|uniref:hypothetical protein n=1 Tax=Paenibacillus pinistramenti TaxID=1768003 RepID=UPI001109B94F|nr:hypothetical protein [Paenibacillus pinistramenti]